jgi:hypothetical protein
VSAEDYFAAVKDVRKSFMLEKATIGFVRIIPFSILGRGTVLT